MLNHLLSTTPRRILLTVTPFVILGLIFHTHIYCLYWIGRVYVTWHLAPATSEAILSKQRDGLDTLFGIGGNGMTQITLGSLEDMEMGGGINSTWARTASNSSYSSPSPSTSSSSSEQQLLVDPVIHHILLGIPTESAPSTWTAARDTCLDMHPSPEYTHIFWDDEKANRFMEEEFPWFVDEWRGYKWVIQRADSLRYFVLLHYGGIFLDLDLVCKTSLEPLRRYEIVNINAFPVGISNGFFMAQKGHPFLRQLVHGLRDFDRNWFNIPYLNIMFSTGPMFLSAEHLRFSRRSALRILGEPIHRLNGRVSTPLFKHLGSSSWHGSDVAFLKQLGRLGSVAWAGAGVVLGSEAFWVAMVGLFVGASIVWTYWVWRRTGRKGRRGGSGGRRGGSGSGNGRRSRSRSDADYYNDRRRRRRTHRIVVGLGLGFLGGEDSPIARVFGVSSKKGYFRRTAAVSDRDYVEDLEDGGDGIWLRPQRSSTSSSAPLFPFGGRHSRDSSLDSSLSMGGTEETDTETLFSADDEDFEEGVVAGVAGRRRAIVGGGGVTEVGADPSRFSQQHSDDERQEDEKPSLKSGLLLGPNNSTWTKRMTDFITVPILTRTLSSTSTSGSSVTGGTSFSSALSSTGSMSPPAPASPAPAYSDLESEEAGRLVAPPAVGARRGGGGSRSNSPAPPSASNPSSSGMDEKRDRHPR